MRCTERASAATAGAQSEGRVRDVQPLRRVLVFGSVLGGGLGPAGCALRRPGAEPPPPSAPPGGPGAPAPTAARNWDEFRRNAARRLVAAHPGGTYLGPVPETLFGIPVIETELNADGTIRSMRILRRPANPMAADTVQLAIDAIRRAAPYGDVSRLPRPWKWVETFLFDDQRRFKPRSLD